MDNFWREYVDQIAFVDYNPWENSYEKAPNNISEACSDLWRRMFVCDGKVNLVMLIINLNFYWEILEIIKLTKFGEVKNMNF